MTTKVKKRISPKKKTARVVRSTMGSAKKASAVKSATSKVRAKARVDFVKTVRK
jgi:predicted nucleic acid-binding protein